MRIFLSYSSEDRNLVEPIYLALRSEGHKTFFDRAELPPGEEYDTRIRKAVESSNLFVFLVSPASLKTGSYTLTELDIAQKTWDQPGGRLLPVMLQPMPLNQIPPYLKAVTLLEPQGNIAASVADAVERIARERRSTALKLVAKAAAAMIIVAIGAAIFFAKRPAASKGGKESAPSSLIPAGKFIMGDDEESPQREIYLNGFYIDTYEVTVSQYAKFLQATGGVNPPEEWEEANPEKAGALPVIGVSWNDADAYCRWAGKRLPTEAEWEKSARGNDERSYPWGNDKPSKARANFGKSSESPYRGGLSAVGKHDAGKSPYGVQDLAGNVAEWVADWFTEGVSTTDLRNPKGLASGTARVIRGGGWHDPPDRIKSTRRMYAQPENRADDIGFRCARDL